MPEIKPWLFSHLVRSLATSRRVAGTLYCMFGLLKYNSECALHLWRACRHLSRWCAFIAPFSSNASRTKVIATISIPCLLQSIKFTLQFRQCFVNSIKLLHCSRLQYCTPSDMIQQLQVHGSVIHKYYCKPETKWSITWQELHLWVSI